MLHGQLPWLQPCLHCFMLYPPTHPPTHSLPRCLHACITYVYSSRIRCVYTLSSRSFLIVSIPATLCADVVQFRLGKHTPPFATRTWIALMSACVCLVMLQADRCFRHLAVIIWTFLSSLLHFVLLRKQPICLQALQLRAAGYAQGSEEEEKAARPLRASFWSNHHQSDSSTGENYSYCSSYSTCEAWHGMFWMLK